MRKLGGWIDGKFQDTLTVLDEMIFGQRLETAGSNEALGEHDPSSDGELLTLDFLPTVSVLQQTRKRSCFKRALEILVSGEESNRDKWVCFFGTGRIYRG